MTVMVAWLRLELRRRWRSLTVLALLVAFATTVVLGSVAGARRGASATDRLLDRTLPATATVLPNQPGFDWNKIRAIPGVEAVGTFPVSGLTAEGVAAEEGVQFPSADTESLRTIERPVVLAGRMFDMSRVDEVVVTSRFPAAYHKGVGDTVTLRLATPQEIDAGYEGGDFRATGPAIKARIVGVVRSGWYSDAVGSKGSLVVSPAIYATYPKNFIGAKGEVYINALVRLRGGEAALPAFRADLARVTGRSDIDVWNNADMARHTRDVNDFEAKCLLAFGLAALVAALFLVGQSVARYSAATMGDLGALRAVGMTPRQAVGAASAGPFLAAVAGATLGVAGAWVTSAWSPIMAASLYEPDPGLQADWLVLAPGWLAVPLLVLAGAAVAAWLTLIADRAALSPRRSAVALAAARAGLPVPVVVGARFAFEAGRGRSAVPVRPALFGAVAGVLGVLAAFTFSAGVADAAANPARFGQTHQLESFFGFNGQDFGPTSPVLTAVARDRDVIGVDDARIGVAQSGDISVTTYTYASAGKPLPVVLDSGRMPATADEAVLAPTSARRLNAKVGSTVKLTGSSKSGPMPVTVSGIGFVPEGSHNDYDEGAWLTPAGHDRFFPKTFKFHGALIALRPGVSAEAVRPRLEKAASAAVGGQPVSLETVQPPPEVAEIRDVRVLPIVLGGFLGLLAIGAVGHALATAVRRRRHDVAVLRALGMTRGQSRGVVITQATLLAAVGIAFGVPVGLALGRTVWRTVAETTPLAYHPPLALLALLLVLPVALLVANVLAAWPGRRAARLHIGQTLRAE
jgi:hypothetical protein